MMWKTCCNTAFLVLICTFTIGKAESSTEICKFIVHPNLPGDERELCAMVDETNSETKTLTEINVNHVPVLASQYNAEEVCRLLLEYNLKEFGSSTQDVGAIDFAPWRVKTPTNDTDDFETSKKFWEGVAGPKLLSVVCRPKPPPA